MKRSTLNVQEGGKGRWVKGANVEGYRRDTCSTRRREATGESLLRKDASSFAEATADRSKARLPAPRRGREGPIYVSAKRTHRFGAPLFLYHICCQLFMSFAVTFCRWVRFGKRTQFWGVFGAVLTEKWVRLWRKLRYRGVSNSAYRSVDAATTEPRKGFGVDVALHIKALPNRRVFWGEFV